MNKCIIINFDEYAIGRPLGSHRIATILRNDGWDAEVIDFGAYWDTESLKQLMKQRVDSNFKFLGISGIFLNRSDTQIRTFVDWFKSDYPHVKVILGSPQRYRFDIKNIDYNINGFGEHALFALLKYLFSNGPAPNFSLNFNSGKNISANDHYPAFPMKSLMVKYEDRDFIQPDEWLGVEFARGCAFSCSFCNFPVLGVKGDYTRDADDFKEQMLDAYDRFGVENYFVSDETFNDRTEKITKFADVVEQLPFDPYFTGFIRGDLLVSRPKDKEELLRMNFLGQFYGIETFYHTTGKAIGKGMNPDRLKQGLLDIRQYFEKYKKHHYRGHISLIAGLPHEPIESLYETKNWIWDNWQGQAYTMFPLEIPMSEYLTKSKLSQDWEKRGYRDAQHDIDMKEYMLSKAVMEHDKILIWKNEHMSINDAERISVEVEYMREVGNFYLDNFSLIKIGLPGGLEGRLSIQHKDELPSPMPFIKNYISKKLGL